MIERTILQTIKRRIAEPRQVGKTTLINQLTSTLQQPWHYVSADLATLQSSSWIQL